MASKGRPKNKRPHEIKLIVPKDTEIYRMKHLYWALLEMEKKMSKDITSVRMADYTTILKEYTELASSLKKKGLIKYAKEGMDSSRSNKSDTKRGGASRTGKDGPSGVGVGVPAFNPIT